MATDFMFMQDHAFIGGHLLHDADEIGGWQGYIAQVFIEQAQLALHAVFHDPWIVIGRCIEHAGTELFRNFPIFARREVAVFFFGFNIEAVAVIFAQDKFIGPVMGEIEALPTFRRFAF